MTLTTEDRTHYLMVANEVRKQAGAHGLGVVGASDLMFLSEGAGGLTFIARLHLAGQSRARKMRVTIALNGMDYYDITVCRPDFTEIQVGSDVDATSLTRFLYNLDSEGVPK